MKIVLSAVVALLLIGCSDNKSTTQESAQAATPVKTEVVKEAAAVEKLVTPKEEKVVVVEEKISPKKVEKKVVEAVVPVATKTTKAPKEAVAQPVATAVDGAKLFTVCSSCHGVKAEKKALGKSQVIAGWDSAKIVNALKGYKNGTYGGAMKAVMKGQASKLSDAEINALAQYISKL